MIYNLFYQSEDRSRQRKLVFREAKGLLNKYNACPMPQIKYDINEICMLFNETIM